MYERHINTIYCVSITSAFIWSHSVSSGNAQIHISVFYSLPEVWLLLLWNTRILSLWDKWEGLPVSCHCDNAAVVSIVSTGGSKMDRAVRLMRCLSFFLARLGVIGSNSFIVMWTPSQLSWRRQWNQLLPDMNAPWARGIRRQHNLWCPSTQSPHWACTIQYGQTVGPPLINGFPGLIAPHACCNWPIINGNFLMMWFRLPHCLLPLQSHSSFIYGRHSHGQSVQFETRKVRVFLEPSVCLKARHVHTDLSWDCQTEEKAPHKGIILKVKPWCGLILLQLILAFFARETNLPPTRSWWCLLVRADRVILLHNCHGITFPWWGVSLHTLYEPNSSMPKKGSNHFLLPCTHPQFEIQPLVARHCPHHGEKPSTESSTMPSQLN